MSYARNDARIRAQERTVRDKGSTPVSPTPATSVPIGDGAVISDSKNDCLVESETSQSEGGAGGKNNVYDDDDSLPPPVQAPEGAPLVYT